jgi:hypothetical protein
MADVFEHQTTAYGTALGRTGATWVPILPREFSAQERVDAVTANPNGTNAYTRQVETSRLNQFIGFELALVKQVEFILSAYRDNVFYVWVIIQDFGDSVRREIYERQAAIIEQFPEFEFDFYIISRGARELDELVTESVEIVYEKPRKH